MNYFSGLQTISSSLKMQVERGEVSLRSAAISLYKSGWFNYIPSDREVIKHLHIVI